MHPALCTVFRDYSREAIVICESCGKAVTAGASLCHHCGQKLQLSSTDQGASSARNEALDRLQPPGSGSGEIDEDLEIELWEGAYCSKAMLGHCLLAGPLSLVLLVVSVVFIGTVGFWGIMIAIAAIALLWGALGVLLLYSQWNAHYRLTSRRFIHQSGIFQRTTNRIEVIDMDDITYTQSFIERFVGVGTITIASSDRTHPLIHVRGIDQVAKVADIIDAAQRKERIRRGIFIESV